MDVNNNIDELARKFELSKFSTAPVRFDKEALEVISRKMLSMLDISQISEYLECIGVPNEIREDFWIMAKDNIKTKEELADIWYLCKEGAKSPKVAPEDRQFIEVAISLIGEYPRKSDSWQTLTEELKSLTGRKGKDLFMPLRNFLTGKSDGPDMKKLFPLIQKIQNF